MKHILKDPNVRELIKMFDLEEPSLYNIIVDDYCFVDGKIVISSASVVTEDSVRPVNLQKLVGHLELCNVIFK